MDREKDKMNLLDIIPGLTAIIDRVVPDPKQKAQLQFEMEKIQAEEVKARMGVLQGLLSNKSVFVAGAIPALIWLAVLGLLNNYVLAPWFGIQPINFPDQYWSLLTVVIGGLFGKKVLDKNEFRWPNGNVMTPSKEMDQQKEFHSSSRPEDIQRRLEKLDKKYERNL